MLLLLLLTNSVLVSAIVAPGRRMSPAIVCCLTEQFVSTAVPASAIIATGPFRRNSTASELALTFPASTCTAVPSFVPLSSQSRNDATRPLRPSMCTIPDVSNRQRRHHAFPSVDTNSAIVSVWFAPRRRSLRTNRFRVSRTSEKLLRRRWRPKCRRRCSGHVVREEQRRRLHVRDRVAVGLEARVVVALQGPIPGL
jgi:hypothetical protein